MDDTRSRCVRTTRPPVRGAAPRAAAACAFRWHSPPTTVMGLGAIPVAQADDRRRRRLRSAGGGSGRPSPTASAADQNWPSARPAGPAPAGTAPASGVASTACGQVLRPTTIGVAHKTLPCGTTVRFTYHGRTVLAPVIDRGPYVKGRAFDLTAAAAEELGLEEAGVGMVRLPGGDRLRPPLRRAQHPGHRAELTVPRAGETRGRSRSEG